MRRRQRQPRGMVGAGSRSPDSGTDGHGHGHLWDSTGWRPWGAGEHRAGVDSSDRGGRGRGAGLGRRGGLDGGGWAGSMPGKDRGRRSGQGDPDRKGRRPCARWRRGDRRGRLEASRHHAIPTPALHAGLEPTFPSRVARAQAAQARSTRARIPARGPGRVLTSGGGGTRRGPTGSRTGGVRGRP